MRLPTRNYTRPGFYFITICTKNRIPWFGDIHQQRMRLSDIGNIVERCWCEIPAHFRHMTLDEYVVMPDHIHGILVMGERDMRSDMASVGHGIIPTTLAQTPGHEIVNIPRVGVPHAEPLHESRRHHRTQWKSGCLGAIINQFKSACSRYIHRDYPDFAWQRGYHDRIIRHDNSLDQIRSYIKTNPKRWKLSE